MTSQSETEKSKAATLRVYLLGPPSVEWAEQPFSIFRRQARALLYHLAARLQPVPRESLCFLFWPDIPDAAARRNLTRLLTHLRRELTAPELLLTSRDHVALDKQRAWSDVATFERLCATEESYRRTEALQQAVALYRGPFMAGFSLSDAPEFETWAVTERQTYDRLYLEALTTLIEDQTARGAYEVAISLAQRYLASDDLAEEVHRQLIELYAAAGDRRAALRQFEQCVEVLERELGVDPLPETRTVYEAVLEGTLQPAAAPMVIEPAWAPLPSLDVPLIGRDEVLHQLEELYARARSGQGRVVLVSGEAGIGKSRLVQDFATHLPIQILVLSGTGYPETQTMPYQPLVEALRSTLNVQAPTWNVPPIWLAEASRLLPELHTLYPDLPAPLSAEPDEARSRLFEALSQLTLGLAAGPHPVLLFLDDIHWADGATLDWLVYLGRQLQASRLLILGTFRSEEADAVSKLRHGLTRLRVLTELKLAELDSAAILDLLHHLDGNVADEEAVAGWLQQATGGNPFFLMETLQALVEAGQPLDSQLLADPANLPLSDAVREAVETRLGLLDSKARQVLEAGAILGSTFGFDLIRQTAGRSEMETMDGLDELVGRRLLAEKIDRYQFHHDLIRTAVYRDLSHGRQRLLHRRAGEALEKLRPDVVATLTRPFERSEASPQAARCPETGRTVEIAVRLARHFSEAGEAEKAIPYLLLAGDRTRGLYAHQEAIDHYERALSLLREQADYEQTARTLMKLGLSYHNAFDFRQARRAYEEGFALWERAARTPTLAPLPAPQALRADWSQPLTTLDPTIATDFHSTGVIDQLFSGLVEYSPEMEIIPDVARTWEILDGGRTYVFYLRDDVRWSDGAPVTAEDFAYAWKRSLTPATESPCATLLYDVKGARAFHQAELSDPDQVGVRARDRFTLVVELAEPTGHFLQLLAYSVTYPVPRHVVEAQGESWANVENIVTNGPFRLEAWRRDEAVVLERNPTYHGRFSGNLQRVELSFVADPGTRLQEYESGGLDVLLLWGLPPAEMDRTRQRHAEEYISGPFLYTLFIIFDVSRPPFDDPHLRRALVLATDRETLANVVMGGTEFPATGGLVPPGMPGHSPELGLPYDRNQARQHLVEASYAPGDDPRVPTVDALGFPSTEPISEYLQRQWRENLQVTTVWEALAWPEYVNRLDQARPHLFLMGWAADYPDPDNFLRVNIHMRRLSNWQDESYRALIEKARRVMDQTERMKLYRQADKVLVEEAAIMPLTYGRLHMLVKPWVRKFPISPLKWWFFKDVIVESH